MLLNIESRDISLGETLTQFREFTSSFDPALKGMSLTNADRLREVTRGRDTNVVVRVKISVTVG